MAFVHNLQHDFYFDGHLIHYPTPQFKRLVLKLLAIFAFWKRVRDDVAKNIKKEGSLQLLNSRPLNCPNELSISISILFSVFAGGLLYPGISRLLRLTVDLVIVYLSYSMQLTSVDHGSKLVFRT